MIELTKLNGEIILLNCDLIECVESIPESKVLMTNGRYYIVKETPADIIDRVVEFNRCVFGKEIKRAAIEEAARL